MQQPQQVSFVLITFIQILLRPTEHYITLTLAAASSSSSAVATSSSTARSSSEKVSSRSIKSTRNDQSHQPTRGGGLKRNALGESLRNLSEMEIEDRTAEEHVMAEIVAQRKLNKNKR